jgi:adenylyltransferase/sulfurtransferase
MFPTPPPPGLVPSCAEGGVLGILPGTIGTLQATEAIKLLLGIGQPMIGRMLLYDALEMSFTTIRVRKDPNCPVCGIPADKVELIDYEQFCGMPAHDRSDFGHTNGHKDEDQTVTSEISVSELKARIDAGKSLTILDVRNPIELEISTLENTDLYIPKPQIDAAVEDVLAGRKTREQTVLAQIPNDVEIAIICRTGNRSSVILESLRKVGYQNRLLNVTGGINAWANEIDPTMATY